MDFLDGVNSSDLWSEYNWDAMTFDTPPELFDLQPTVTGYDVNLSPGGEFDYVPLSAPDWGPQAGDMNFTQQGFPGSEEAVNGVPNGPTDQIGPGTGSWLDGAAGQFSGLYKGITAVGTASKTQKQAASSPSGPRNAIDAVTGLLRDLGTTARIVQDTKARITNAPRDINAAVKKAKDMTTTPTQRRAGSSQPTQINPLIWIGLAAIGAVFFLGRAHG